MASRSKIRNFPGRCVLWAARHRTLVRAVVLLLFILSVFLIFSGRFSNDISSMLPDGSRSAKSYSEINRSGMFNKIILSFHLKDGRPFGSFAVGPLLERKAAELERLPRVKHVDYQYLAGDFAENRKELSLYLPQLHSPSEIGMDSASIEKTVRSLFRRMVMPSSIGQIPQLRADPFGLNASLFGKLQEFQTVTGMKISPKFPYLISMDEKQAMMLLESDVPVSDAVNARRLLDSIHAVLKTLPEEVSCSVISAHRRAVYNETVLRGDVKTVCWISTVLFALLFVVFYRCDVRSFLIPLIPLLASSIVLGVMALTFGNVLFFVVGMGGIVISLAVDYGIHTYAVMTGKGRFFRLIRIVPALCAGALTSIAAFVLFSFSGTEGIRQLGFFAGASLLLSLLLMLFLLPSILSGGKQHEIRFHAPSLPFRHPRLLAFGWLCLLLLCAGALFRLNFNSDVRQFDVSPKAFDEEEAGYAKSFMSGTRPAMLLFQGTEKEQVRKNAENTLAVLRAKTESVFFSPSDLFPAREKRMENLDEWRVFLRNGGLEKLRSALNAAARKYEFSADFFAPFFDGIQKGAANPPDGPPRLLEPLLKRFEVRNGGFYTLAVLFPDRPELVAQVESLTGNTVVSRNGLAAMMSDDVTGGMALRGGIALLLVVLITRCFFRDFTDVFLALVPVLTSLAVTGAVFAVCGTGINLSVLIAAIILVGLSVDYGIFMVHSQRNGGTDDGIFNAVTLSAVTSAAGGATVVFTRHPMLRDAGLTLIIGISTAWLTGILIVPALKNLVGKKRPVLLPCLLCCAAVLLSSCASDPFEYEPLSGKPEPGEIADLMPPEAIIESSVVGEYRFSKMPLLSLTRIDFRTGMIRVAGLTPAGMKIFDLCGTKNSLENYHWLPGKYWSGHEEEASRMILGDISAIYLNLLPERFGNCRYENDGKQLAVTDGDIRYVFAGAPPRLIEKSIFENGSRIMRIKYYSYENAFPANIMLENFKYKYRLVIRTLSVERGIK